MTAEVGQVGPDFLGLAIDLDRPCDDRHDDLLFLSFVRKPILTRTARFTHTTNGVAEIDTQGQEGTTGRRRDPASRDEEGLADVAVSPSPGEDRDLAGQLQERDRQAVARLRIGGGGGSLL